jgi:hypothetical protein
LRRVVIGRPRRIRVGRRIGRQCQHVAAVSVHPVDVEVPIAVALEGEYPSTELRGPRGVVVGSSVVRQAPLAAAARRDGVELGVPVTVGNEDDPAEVPGEGAARGIPGEERQEREEGERSEPAHVAATLARGAPEDPPA